MEAADKKKKSDAKLAKMMGESKVRLFNNPNPNPSANQTNNQRNPNPNPNLNPNLMTTLTPNMKLISLSLSLSLSPRSPPTFLDPHRRERRKDFGGKEAIRLELGLEVGLWHKHYPHHLP
jgi:hypothetical protein